MVTDVFDLLVKVEIQLWDAVDARLRDDHDLALGRVQVLRAIGRRRSAGGGCRVADVAEDLLVTTGGVSKLVDRLEAAGLCRRVANPGDRRSSLLDLTARGSAVLAAVEETVDDELTRRLAALPDQDVRRLAALLQRVAGR